MSDFTPRRLLAWALRRKGRADILSEMDELYVERARRVGSFRAALWYWRQLPGFILRWPTIKPIPGRGISISDIRAASWGLPRSLDSVAQDLRFSLRTLGNRPLFALTTILTLGLGIGAATTVYAVADAVLLKELPFADAERLVSIWTSRLNDRGEWVTSSLYYPEFLDVEANATSLEDVALFYFAGSSIQDRKGRPMNLTTGEGTPTLPDVVGIQPMLGRWFLPEEVGPEEVNVVVLGESFWRDRFGADPEVLGSTIQVEHDPYTVIGVMPAEFRLRLRLFSDSLGLLAPRASGEQPIWIPTGHNYGESWHVERSGFTFEAIARLKPGVTMETALAEVEPLVQGPTPPDRLRVHMAPRADLEVAGLPTQLLLLAIPSLLLLLIACGNVATLHLGEAEGRRHEISTRMAIGARSGRIVRQLLTESVVLGLMGSVAGFGIAAGATRVLVAFAPANSVVKALEVDLSVLAFSSAAGILAGMAFGLAPALGLRLRRGGSLRHLGERAETRRGRGADLVLSLEVALTVVLLVTGGLFTRTLMNLMHDDMGFETRNLVVLRAAMSGSLGGEERAPVYQEILRQMEEVPGVVATTGSWAMPLHMRLWTEEVATESDDLTEGSQWPIRQYDIVMPNYHEVMGVPLLAGRYFTEADDLGAPPVVIVSESLAREMWPGESAVGKRLFFRRRPEWHTVVGVVGDVNYDGLGTEVSAPIYRPFLQNPGLNGIRLVLTARVVGDPGALTRPLQEAVWRAYPPLVLREGSVMSVAVAQTATDQRYRALMVMAFGLAAVALAAVGMFGVVARGVARRNREMAIRLALGAESLTLRALALGSTMMAAAAGLAAGFVGAGWAGSLIERHLFGVRAFDGWAYGAAILTVVCVCGLASYLPTSRLLLLQPATVLKEE
jgi:predicted permease